MQSVYVSAGLNAPAAIDNWWHSPSIGYQLNQDKSAPAIIIINLCEGEPDIAAKRARFIINLNRLNVLNKDSGNRFAASHDLIPLLNEVRQWVCAEVTREKEAREQARRQELRRLEEVAEDKKKRMKAFMLLLQAERLLEDSNLEVQQLNLCPICSSPVAECQDCNAFSCRNPTCQASRVMVTERCPNHASACYCHPCLEKLNPKLTRCPECLSWLCTLAEFQWCPGKPSGRRSTRSAMQRANSHPKVIACNHCLSRNINLRIRINQCSSSSCWSKKTDPNLRQGFSPTATFICDKCSPEGGEMCECYAVWICDTCTRHPSQLPFSTCPRCRKSFCGKWRCNKTRSCAGCGVSPPCDDCMKEDEKSSHPDALTCSCEACNERFCERCWEQVAIECGSCSKFIEEECSKRCPNDECEDDTHYCEECARHSDCASCSIPISWDGYDYDEGMFDDYEIY